MHIQRRDKRSRDYKIHPWVNRTIFRKFDDLAYKLGFSRDGALEKALLEFIKKYSKEIL